jgi:hypothetical protein
VGPRTDLNRLERRKYWSYRNSNPDPPTALSRLPELLILPTYSQSISKRRKQNKCVGRLAGSLTVKMEAARSSETSVGIYETKQYQIP